MNTNNQNNNDNQTNLSTDNQDVLNQNSSSISSNDNLTQDKTESNPDSLNVKMSEAPKVNAPLDPPFIKEPQSSEKSIDSPPPQSSEVIDPKTTESLKDYNAVPINSPPVPNLLSDNLEASKSLTEESSSVKNDNFKTSSPSETTPETQPQDVTQPETPSETTPETQPQDVTQPETPLETTPETQPQDVTQPETSPEPNLGLDSEPKIQSETVSATDTFSTNQSAQNPQDIKQKIEDVLSYSAQGVNSASLSDKKSGSRLLKFLFTLSLIIFVLIVGALVYLFINPVAKTTSPELKTDAPQTESPSQSGAVCELNGFIYNLGQSFPSADGCNSCTCVSADNITCTEKNCTGNPSTTIVPTTPVTSSISATPTISTNSSTIKTTPAVVKTKTTD